MKITELMETDLQTCRPDDSLEDAAGKMWRFDLGALPVVAPGNHLVGMVTDRDICMCSLIEGLPLSELQVSLAATAPAKACGVEASLSEVLAAMQAHQVHRIPVVDAEQKLVGIVGLSDVVRAASTKNGGTSPQALARTLAAIMKPREPAAPLQEASPAREKQPL